MTTTSPLKVGMRFDPRDAPLLRDLAERCQRQELPTAAIIYRGAASDATTGEPYIVVCKDISEARSIAAEFVLQGIRPPVLDTLNG